MLQSSVFINQMNEKKMIVVNDSVSGTNVFSTILIVRRYKSNLQTDKLFWKWQLAFFCMCVLLVTQKPVFTLHDQQIKILPIDL